MTTKVAKKLPKRVGNAKRKQARANSWIKGLKAKDDHKVGQASRERHNATVGCTGKMRLYNPNHSNACERGEHVAK
jgi:hypothetical protein